ncbi:MAG: hypothetical protein IPG84_13965 [Betaproteobacteria bacterium]|nr:hypothetical protein [Betaproteobacteria bacterium]
MHRQHLRDVVACVQASQEQDAKRAPDLLDDLAAPDLVGALLRQSPPRFVSAVDRLRQPVGRESERGDTRR